MSKCHETSPGLERADFAEIERKFLGSYAAPGPHPTFGKWPDHFRQHVGRCARHADAATAGARAIDETVYAKWDPETNRSLAFKMENRQLATYAKAFLAAGLECPDLSARPEPLASKMEEALRTHGALSRITFDIERKGDCLEVTGTPKPWSKEEIEEGFIAMRAALSAVSGVYQADTKGLDKGVLIDAILRPVRKYL